MPRNRIEPAARISRIFACKICRPCLHTSGSKLNGKNESGRAPATVLHIFHHASPPVFFIERLSPDVTITERLAPLPLTMPDRCEKWGSRKDAGSQRGRKRERERDGKNFKVVLCFLACLGTQCGKLMAFLHPRVNAISKQGKAKRHGYHSPGRLSY